MNTKPIKKSADGKLLRWKSRATIALASMMVAVCMIASVAAQPAPFMISGYVFCEDGSECNNPCVNITNLNTNGEWQAETNISSHYYQLILATSVNINASERLRFNVTSPDGSQLSTAEHTVTSEEINNGGLFNFDIMLSSTTDWNPWDDDCIITDVEISMAEYHWATSTPKNGHTITDAEISLLEYQWATGDVC